MPVSTTMRHMLNIMVITLCGVYSLLIFLTPQVCTVHLLIKHHRCVQFTYLSNTTGAYNLLIYQTTHIFNSIDDCKVTMHFSDGKVGKIACLLLG
jgi:hypothetical protein